VEPSINVNSRYGSDDPSLSLLEPAVNIPEKPNDQPQDDEDKNDPAIHQINARLCEDFRRYTLTWKSRYQHFAQ